jgi:hypothetical protein
LKAASLHQSERTDKNNQYIILKLALMKILFLSLFYTGLRAYSKNRYSGMDTYDQNEGQTLLHPKRVNTS